MRGTLTFLALGLGLVAPATASAAEIIAIPGNRFLEETTEIPQGEKVDLLNRDLIAHDVTARPIGPDGKPLFASPLVQPLGQAPVDGTQYLVAGSYPFVCSVHPGMEGTLRVTSEGAPEPRPGGGGGGGGATADTTVPRLTVAGGRKLTARVTSDEAVAVAVTARSGRTAIARGKALLDGGAPTNVKLKLTKAGKSRLRARRSMRVTFAVQGRDAAGNLGKASARGVLRR